LHFDTDYIRGRRIKTRIAVHANGTMKREIIGRGISVTVGGEVGKVMRILIDPQQRNRLEVAK
jgi:hypothetical protein